MRKQNIDVASKQQENWKSTSETWVEQERFLYGTKYFVVDKYHVNGNFDHQQPKKNYKNKIIVNQFQTNNQLNHVSLTQNTYETTPRWHLNHPLHLLNSLSNRFLSESIFSSRSNRNTENESHKFWTFINRPRAFGLHPISQHKFTTSHVQQFSHTSTTSKPQWSNNPLRIRFFSPKLLQTSSKRIQSQLLLLQQNAKMRINYLKSVIERISD